ncbi:PREDICTED: leucine-rich repeat-containing protein 58 [Nicrophorus vespilloides]|uniref:Leucine-rich repeat protein soc-2 homolog n=1 Tax=Nicrophorus vespilloides TaxID=110193 RepID=A0ABM1NC62_NICVS|nr:PREDICTED: leucine-rich repeat-containing protein 58 [Nicrophorus vespilloides]
MDRIHYSSDSSDGEQNAFRVLDFGRLGLDTATLEHNLITFCEDERKSTGNVEVISLHHNRLQLFPENIVKFSNLRSLDISSNGLAILPDVFEHCQLTTLIAKNNSLTSESLPKTFTVCPSLRELNLNGNHLSHFPEQIFDFPNLRYLYLGGNRITKISKNIGKLHSLQILSMGGNLLNEVPASLGTLKSLHALILCDNLLESLPSNIANLHNLKSLMLHRNKLRTLPPEIVALKNLTELSLRDNPLVVRFVSDMTHNPASLLELSARAVKVASISVEEGDIPKTLYSYLGSAHHCVNPRCKGVFFDNRVEHIKFVDFCGKYRIPLLQYLCSSKCITGGEVEDVQPVRSYMMRKVLLG